MKKLIIGLTFLFGMAFTADVTLYVSGQVVDNVNGGTLDIYMVNSVDVYGFQLQMNHSGLIGTGDVTYGNAVNGTAAEYNFMVSTNTDGLILGFSLTGDFIPAGEGVLTTIEWDADAQALSGPVTLEVTNVAGFGGVPLDAEVGSAFLSSSEATIIEDYSLSANYPNPFNPVTTIDYAVKEAGDVSIIVYDMLGREVNVLVNDYMLPNNYHVVWNGTNMNGEQVASGVYYYKMIAKDFIETKKMLFMK